MPGVHVDNLEITEKKCAKNPYPQKGRIINKFTFQIWPVVKYFAKTDDDMIELLKQAVEKIETEL